MEGIEYDERRKRGLERQKERASERDKGVSDGKNPENPIIQSKSAKILFLGLFRGVGVGSRSGSSSGTHYIPNPWLSWPVHRTSSMPSLGSLTHGDHREGLVGGVGGVGWGNR